jgi:glycosyltransferase involved in cell wall biosynthesis
MPRVAIFTDSYHEANGAARTFKALEACAKRRDMSLLSVHAGPETRLVHDDSIIQLDLKRSRLASFRFEHDLRFDLAIWRYVFRVKAILKWFAPDVLHLTGAGDVSQLGAHLGHRLNVPMVASSHVLMPIGVDTDLFTPARRRHPNWMVNIGYVGRLSAEKNVRLLRSLEEALDAEGLDVRFTIVGDGSEREWLERYMQRAEFMGVLHAGELATAYAEMDIVVFASEGDGVGNVVLEAMASGVPVVAMDRQDFIDAVRGLVKNRARRDALGAAARAHALARSSWDRNFYDICKAYDLAISLASRKSPAAGAPPALLPWQRKSA